MTLLNPTAKKPRKQSASPHPPELGDGKAHPGRRMTEREFVEWADAKTRAEWVDGEVIMMPPVSDEHDDLNGWLRSVLQLFVEHHRLGRVKGPEFMVRLGKQRRRRVPDILFVARNRVSLIHGNHMEGAPDLVVELVSRESTVRDWRDKYLEYQKAGVREYWVIDRPGGKVELNVLGMDGRFQAVGPEDDVFRSAVVPGFFMKRRWLMGKIRPSILQAAKELGVA